MNVHWCYSTPRLCCNYCCQISDFPHARPESFISDCVEFMLRLLMCTVSWARLLLSKVILNWKYTHILIHMIIQASDIMYTYFSWLSDDPISGLIDISLVNRYSYWSHRTLIMRLTCTLQERLAGQTGDEAKQAGRSKSWHSHQVF